MRACRKELGYCVGKKREMERIVFTHRVRISEELLRRIFRRGWGRMPRRRFWLERVPISLPQIILGFYSEGLEMLECSRGKKFSLVGRECGGSTMRFYRMWQIIMRRSGGGRFRRKR